MFEISDDKPTVFAADDKVVCVDDSALGIFSFGISELKCGTKYTVKYLSSFGSLYLQEIEGGYMPSRFKKCSR